MPADKLRTPLLLVFIAALLPVMSGGCDSDALNGPTGDPNATFEGPRRDVGAGQIWSFVTFDGEGNPLSAGVRFTEDALASPPPDILFIVIDAVPEAKAVNVIFDHFEIRYWPDGHNPPDLLDEEHFDFYPFLISEAARNNIRNATGADSARVLKVPRIDEIPVGFAPIPNADEFYVEARYGTRYFDVAQFTPVFEGTVPFTAATTIFYGYFDGKVTFYEVPITFAYLRNRPDGDTVVNTFAVPKEVHREGYWPGSYSMSFNPATREYTLAMGNFEYREP